MPHDKPSPDPHPGLGEPDLLHEYRSKRQAEGTPEPFGGAQRGRAVGLGSAGTFVVQLHAARRRHFDLRLELDGVLKSWAVPRGPSLDPEEKRLAVLTEDHPLDYDHFEGVIPEGHYGAGAMIVWDRGSWVPLEVDPRDGLRDGKLLFELRGFKLRGVWTLFRTRPPANQRTGGPEDDRHWILMKKPDGAARSGSAQSPEDGVDEDPFDPRSILSGLTVDELADGADRLQALIEQLPRTTGKRIDPRTVRPMLATPAGDDRPSADDAWLHEIKYDGYRLLAAKENGQPFLRYRNGAEVTHLFPEIAAVIRALPVENLLLDGEVVVLQADGRPSFQRLQQRAQLAHQPDVRHAAVHQPATLFVFDALSVDGHDLRRMPLVERKKLLEQVVPRSGNVRYCEHVVGQGRAFLEQVRALGLEGMMAKRAASKYQHRRSDDWLKHRIDQVADFVVVGLRLPQEGSTRAHFAALHLASLDRADGSLRYAGRVGSGFSDARLGDLAERLEPLIVEAPSKTPEWLKARDRMVTPRLRCRVRFKERTDSGQLRHPVFLEELEPLPEEFTAIVPARVDTASSRRPPEPPPKLHFTNLDKTFWPEEGYTKGDLIEYYRRVGPRLLPLLKDRPLVLTRYPDGIDGKNFFQKHSPDFVPSWIRTEKIWSGDGERDTEYLICNDLDSLLYLANLGTIPLHLWSSRLNSLDRPDWCILDLDPKEAPFTDVVRIARETHRICEQMQMPSFVKTSGSSGLHVLLPLGAQCSYEQSKAIAGLIGQLLTRRLPDIATMTRNPAKREGRVYVDTIQNGRGRLLVAPYCVRPLPGAPVSTPLRWPEVTSTLTIAQHNLRSVPQRIARQRNDPWVDLLGLKPDLVAAIDRLQELFAESD